MMTRMSGRRKRWMVKVNCGFCGNQSALLCLKARDYEGSKVSDILTMCALLNVASKV